jgi:hypothetical protein
VASSTRPVHSTVAWPPSEVTWRPYAGPVHGWVRCVTSSCRMGHADAPGHPLRSAQSRAGPSETAPRGPASTTSRTSPAATRSGACRRPAAKTSRASPARAQFVSFPPNPAGEDHPPPRAQPEGRGGMPSGGTRARPRCPRFGLPPRRCISGWLRLGLSGPASHLVIRPSARTLPSEGLKPALTRPEARLPHSASTPTTAPRSALSRAASITSKPAIASESGTGGGASSWIAATIPS